MSDRVWAQLWVAPVVGTVLAVAAATGVLALDAAGVTWPLPRFEGSGDSAHTLLSAVITSIATLLALVFTIVAVVIQLASNQYSPRLLRPLVKDRPTHLTIGVFVATIVYALVALHGLDAAGGDDPVASIAVSLGLGLGVVSIGTFAAYSNHIVHAVRVEHVIGLAARTALELIDGEHPHAVGDAPADASGEVAPPGPPTRVVRAETGVTLVGVDTPGLVEAARASGTVVVLVPRVGSYVRSGGPLLEVHGDGGPVDADLRRRLDLGSERTTRRDLTYAVRLLADVAARGLSPGDHDPTTSVQALDQLHEVLARLATRHLGDGVHRDGEGVVRLVAPVTDWDAYVELALDEVRRLGAASPQVTRRLLELVDDLHALAPPERRPVLERHRALVVRAVRDHSPTAADVDLGTRPDRQGLGL